MSVSLKVRGTELFGATPPELLVGDRGWPWVRMGPLVAPVEREAVVELSDPNRLFGRSIAEVIELRSQLVRPVFRVHVRRFAGRLVEQTQELALSAQPLDTEVRLEKPLRPVLRFDGVLAPAGPSGRVRSLRVVDNPVVPRKVDGVVSDRDVRTVDAVVELYEAGVSNYYITRLLAAGLLGRAKDRMVVPSRWSITAVDAMLAKHLMDRIRSYPELGEVWLFSAYYAGNRFEVLLLPGRLAYEFVEVMQPDSVWTKGAREPVIESDYELERGRSTFSRLGGGYYAAKLPVMEFLDRVRRQAHVLAIREVTPDYWAPLGSWKIREALRRAFQQSPRRFDSVEEALRDMANRIGVPFEQWYRKAVFTRTVLEHRRLTEFE